MAVTKFTIEYFDENTHRYEQFWSGTDIHRANIMFNKRYIRRYTRRMRRITDEIIDFAKKEKKS